jgi:DNA-binding response OmpR family regulator
MIRILIVEDDENISKMLAATLSIGDYEYDRCVDGEEAVQTIINGTYDLILLDVMLPGMDGFAVLEHIRGESCETPVIFLTALGAVADKVKGLRGGAEDYIVKPFEPVELLARIEVVLRRAGKSEMHLRYGDIQVDIEKHTALKNGVPVALTPKEFDVLVFFMRTLPSRASSCSQTFGALISPVNRAAWTFMCSRCAAKWDCRASSSPFRSSATA